MKFQEQTDPRLILTIAPFPQAEASHINAALSAERNRYYHATLSQLFAFVGIANMFSSYDELAIQTLGMFTRCGSCKDGVPYTYGVIGSPEVCVMAVCEKCYHDFNHPKWILFPPMDH